jgi:oligoendopeptidase F
MMRDASPDLREAAWTGIQETWTQNQASAANILNALAGWRLEICKKRSRQKEMHFLQDSLFQNRVTAETVNSMMQACYERAGEVRKVGVAMAKVLGKNSLDPWDLTAPCPELRDSLSLQKVQTRDLLSYQQAFDRVVKSFDGVSGEFSDFVKMAGERNWIDARYLPNKGVGAYCAGFAKIEEPRVFMSFKGSNQDVTTLAHELGHALHSWLMRDLPFAQRNPPMTLAETASVFAETVLREESLKHAKTAQEKLAVLWEDADAAIGFLLNIPVRYEFEKEFYEQRKTNVLSADELSALMEKYWKKWYGEAASKPDRLFWAHKQHFSFADASFYNYPYTFGFLFSLSIYSQREKLGPNFWPKYKAILRDTGRMTAEDLIQHHLGQNIRDPQFWHSAIDLIITKLNQFCELAAELGY